MARWEKFKVLVHNMDEEDYKETLGIKDLEVETFTSTLYLDMDRVEFFTHTFDSEGEPREDQSSVVLQSGITVTLEINSETLLKKLKNE